MAINFINPNFSMINTIQKTTAAQGSSLTESTTEDTAARQSFSDVLENIITNTIAQNGSSVANAASNKTGSTVNLDEIFQKASDTYHVPVELLKAVAKAESNFDPNAGSSAGAQGIMQLMPATAKALGVTNTFDPEQNIMGGAKYLSQQLERYDGNTVLALAAYNAGPGNVSKYNGVPPFEETRNYITKVMGYAGESITAGEIAIQGQTAVTGSGNTLQELALGLLNADISNMNTKDIGLLMDLYRYRMQLDALTDSDSESDSESDFSSNFGPNLFI